jgi:hypothetical protein
MLLNPLLCQAPKRNKMMKILSILGLMLLLNNYAHGQDTLRLLKKPNVILKSWYPEFKESPKLKVGVPKIMFAIIPAFKQMPIGHNDIDLVVKGDFVKIIETDKPNQYLVTVSNTDSSYAEFEVWFDIGKSIILLKENAKWIDIKKTYPFKDNRVMLQKIKLKIER